MSDVGDGNKSVLNASCLYSAVCRGTKLQATEAGQPQRKGAIRPPFAADFAAAGSV